MNMAIAPVRRIALAAALLAGTMAATPAYSATVDVALLQDYVGGWIGRGTTKFSDTGESESIACKMDVARKSNFKVSFKASCALAGGRLSMQGTLGYNEPRNVFEAVLTSNTSYAGQAVTRRRGQTLNFNLAERNPDTGAKVEISSGMTLKNDVITVTFKVVDKGTDAITTAVVPLSRH